MAYTRQGFKDGMVLSAEHLRIMEDGILDGGRDGYTPVKGVDYFTEEDIAEIVARVLAELPESGDDNTGEDTDVVAMLSESQLEGVYDEETQFLTVGEAYYVNDVYFVADEHGNGYAAPPSGTVITTSGNSGEIWYDPAGWGVTWANEAKADRYVIFRKATVE